MNLLKLSWKYLVDKPFSTLLSIILVALGIGLASFIFLVNHQFEDRLYKNIDNIDLVVGAKGSPLQMILSSVYHVDVPTGNLPLEECKIGVLKNPYIEKAIPLALGDNYDGYRIVGTDSQFAAHYNAEIGKGKLFENDLEVTVGARAAQKLNLKIGDTFYGSHGLVEDGGHVHETYPYVVVGLFKPSNLILDQLILTNVSTVWRMHAGHDHDHGDHADHDHDHDDAHGDHAGHDDDDAHGDHAGHDHDDDDAHGDHAGHDHDDAHGDHAGHDHDDDHGDHAGHDHDHGDHADHDHVDHAGHDHDHDHDHGDHAGHDHDHGDHAGHDHAHGDHAGHDHDHGDHAGHDHAHDHGKPKVPTNLKPLSSEGKEITSYLVQYKKDKDGNTSMRATVEATLIIDEYSKSAGYAKPAIQLQRLMEMTGVGMSLLQRLAILILLISAFSMFISLYNSLKARKYEIALMRVMGATKIKLFSVIVIEGLIVALAGYLLGVGISHISMELMSVELEETYKYSFTGFIFLQEEILLFTGALLIGFLAALIPAYEAYSVDISNTLTKA